MFLTPAELERLTGRRRFSAQRRELVRLAVPFIHAATGEPLVRRSDWRDWPNPSDSPERRARINEDLRLHVASAVRLERRNVSGCVYVIDEGDDASPVKIGHSASGSAKQRLASLQTGNSRQLRVARILDGDIEVERLLHSAFDAERVGGEWFVRSVRLFAFLACGSRLVSECLLAAAMAPTPE